MIKEIKKGQLKEKPLGMYLVEAGLITSTQVDTALNEQKVSRKRFGQILSDWGWVEQQTIEYLMQKVVLPERRVVEKKLYSSEKNGYYKQAAVEPESQVETGEFYSLGLLALPTRKLAVHLSPSKTIRFLLFVVLSLVLVGIVGQFCVYYLPDYPFRDLFARLTNLNGEYNLPALYSWSTLIFCSVLLAIITHAKQVFGERYVRQWKALSIIFLYLSLDEALSLHEMWIDPVRTALHTSGIFYFAWVIPYAIFVLVCLLALLRFLAHLPAKTRRLFLIAGTIYIAGAIGMEIVQGHYEVLHGSRNMTMAILTSIEELFEMLGVVVFIFALLSYISCYMKGLVLQVQVIDDKKQRLRT